MLDETNWNKLIRNDISKIEDFMNHYNNELKEARKEINVKGERLVAISSKLPGIHEYRGMQYKTIESVLSVLEIQMKELRSKTYIELKKKSSYDLKSTEINNYIEVDPLVVDLQFIINDVIFLRNRYLTIMETIEKISYSVNTITKLRMAGFDDAIIE